MMKRKILPALIAILIFLGIGMYMFLQGKEADLIDYSSNITASVYIYKFGENELPTDYEGKDVYLALLSVYSETRDVNDSDYSFKMDLGNYKDLRWPELESNPIYSQAVIANYVILNDDSNYQYFVFSGEDDFDNATLAANPVIIIDKYNNEAKIDILATAKIGKW